MGGYTGKSIFRRSDVILVMETPRVTYAGFVGGFCDETKETQSAANRCNVAVYADDSANRLQWRE